MSTLFLILLFLHTHIISSNGVPVFDLNSLKPTELDVMVKRVCSGTIGECPELTTEEDMDSDSNRRLLMMEKRYISYETLRRDLVPCGTPGSSYYNCKGNGVANPYNRGCEIITRCGRNMG